MNKFELRKILKDKRKTLDMENLSDLIIEKLFLLNEFILAKNVFTYISFGHEVDTNKILNLKSKNIFVPKIINDRIIMLKYDENHLLKNKFGILEPENSTEILPNEKDVIIVPALSCDKNFFRLGYGGGYYDKFLKNINSVKVALLPQELFVEKLPSENHDVSVDYIITEQNVFKNTNSVN